MRFLLGTHEPAWLGRLRIPLFLSRRTLCRRKSLPRALGPWALDSGGFSELSMFGEWRTGLKQYVSEVQRWNDEIGSLDWAAIQDWMCEPWILSKTGMIIEEHQLRTCESYLRLMNRAPHLPWTPVLQGWSTDDYIRHADMYENHGVDLASLPIVGVGSVCRRQATGPAGALLKELSSRNLRLHGFGFKIEAFKKGYHRYLESSDSLAWSFAARRSPPISGHTHKNCANCADYALIYREKVLSIVNGNVYPPLTLPGVSI